MPSQESLGTRGDSQIPEIVHTRESLYSGHFPTSSHIDGIAREYIHRGIPGSRELYTKQAIERQDIYDRYHPGGDKPPIAVQRKGGSMDIAAESTLLVEQAKKLLYANLGITENLESGDAFKQFKKGVVDGLLVDNMELVQELIKNGVDTVVKALVQTLSSAESVRRLIMKLIEQFGTDIQNILSMDPYPSGRALGGLGFGVYGSMFKNIGKGALKQEMRAIGKNVENEYSDKKGKLFDMKL